MSLRCLRPVFRLHDFDRPHDARRLLLRTLLAVFCGATAVAQASTPAAPSAAIPAVPAKTSVPAMPSIASMPLAVFQNTLGVNIHIEYTDGKYADAARVLADLQYVGIRNVRDYMPNPTAWRPPGQALQGIKLLAEHGIRFDFVADGNASLPVAMQQLDALLQLYPALANSVEGPNEINNFPVHFAGKPNQQGAEAFQRALYAAVHGDPRLHAVPVYYMTGAAPVNLHASRGLADVANAHPYPHHGEQPYPWLNRDFASYFTMRKGDARVITETGYYTQPASREPGGVDDAAQAALVLNAYFDGALEGDRYTYMYQLLDAYPDPKSDNSDNHFGFFRLDGSPKPIATGLHNLAVALPPDGPSPQKSVHAEITPMPDTAHALALTGSDGSIALFIWNEVPVWNGSTHSPITVAPVPVKVTLPGAWTVRYFAPTAETAVTAPEDAAGRFTGYLCTYPTALLFEPK